MANQAKALERETITVTFKFVDKDGNVLLPGDIDILIVTIHYDETDGTRHYVRSSDDVLNDPGFAISAAGLVTWNVQSYETRFDDESPADELGDTLQKTCTFEVVYASPQSGTLSAPFATTAGSRSVTVTHAAHGLSVNDDISYLAGANVGGLDLSGRYIVETVVDTDTYTIKALATAAETAVGGGSVDWYHGGKYRPDTATLEVTRLDPVG